MPPKKDEQRLLRELLGQAVESLRLPPREIEDRLGIGHGTLRRLLDGRAEMKLRHLLEFCRLLDVHPREVIELAFPGWKASHQLGDWDPPGRRKPRQEPALPEGLLQAIRAAVREEISGAGSSSGSDASKPRRDS
jgi:DNA-binding Xre family transcriptional regulator